jgi:hypothetical protein
MGIELEPGRRGEATSPLPRKKKLQHAGKARGVASKEEEDVPPQTRNGNR